MEPTDLTIEILKDIRTEIRGQRESHDAFARATVQHFEQVDQRFNVVDQRFEIIETSLRDVAEQLVMQSRALGTILEGMRTRDGRIESLDRRLTAVEAQLG